MLTKLVASVIIKNQARIKKPKPKNKKFHSKRKKKQNRAGKE